MIIMICVKLRYPSYMPNLLGTAALDSVYHNDIHCGVIMFKFFSLRFYFRFAGLCTRGGGLVPPSLCCC